MKFLLLALFVAAASAAPTESWRARFPPALLATGWTASYSENDGKIVGGSNATPHEFPFIISMRRSGSHSCGGSIHDANHVITAAHCVRGVAASQLTVVAGEHDRSVNEGTEQIVQVSAHRIHEQYNANTYVNDIAILVLASPLNLAPQEVGAVQLPQPLAEIAAGTPLTVTGWGTLTSGGSTLPNILQKVDVPAVTDATCNQSYPNQIVPSMICAGRAAGGVDSCQGDSGGPLIERRGGEILVGIVSWGRGCALPNYYGVYTQVSYFLDWIATNTQP